ncbi:MAG: bifunctional UDP-N-acetylglucosamine diphosphorylase/glucosamine-1-phosphate N-acetyltransferase GlmU, partial [Deltaproteobacteria bacterium HGW-Deltaproteobacteria-1]
MNDTKFCALILAAGLEAARNAKAEKIVVIVGHQSDKVRESFPDPDLVFVQQMPQLGTGHAVMQAADALKDYQGLTVILCGDVPLLKPQTIRRLISSHQESQSCVTVLTTEPPGPHAYGRIVKDDQGDILKIVEHRDANDAEKEILEINTGIYCVE